MSESKASIKKQPNRTALIITIGAVLAVLGAGFLVWAGVTYLFPKPLTLKPGEKITGRVTIDTSGPFYIGDLIPVTIIVESRTGITCPMPDLVETNPHSLEIKSKSKPVFERRRDGLVLKLHFLVTGWETGAFTIPSFKVDYQYKAKPAGSFQISGRKITINSTLPPNKTNDQLLKLDIKGLKGPVGLPPRYQILWFFLAGIVLLVFIGLLVKALHKMARQKEPGFIADSVIMEPAHVIALRRLEAIRNANYLANGDFKTYYSELSECVREYMENRFQIRALEMTTEEFLTYLSAGHRLKLEFQMILRDFLGSSDLVKFAKHLPLLEEAGCCLTIIHQLIEATKEVPGTETEQALKLNRTNQTENLEEQLS
jgi:hypothetical protein